MGGSGFSNSIFSSISLYEGAVLFHPHPPHDGHDEKTMGSMILGRAGEEREILDALRLMWCSSSRRRAEEAAAGVAPKAQFNVSD